MRTLISVKGLVIRTVNVREADRLVVIFTEEMGVVTALARSARSIKSKKMAATIDFCYSNFILEQKGDYYYVKEVELIESFFDIRYTVEGFALAGYIAEVLSDVTVAEAERDLLRLSLNSLYAISKGIYPLNKIKAAFEIRTASIIGFMPDVILCSSCGEGEGVFYFDIMGGSIQCAACKSKAEKTHSEEYLPHEARIVCILTPGAKTALEYCVHCPIEKILSFNISDEDMEIFAKAAQQYILNQLERSFKTLDFYHEVTRNNE